MNAQNTTALVATLFAFSIVLLSGCTQPFDFADSGDVDAPVSVEPVPIRVSGASFVLAWDPAPQQVSTYNVYYRSRGAGQWRVLSDVAAGTSPSYRVTTGELSHGSYEFAVRAIGASGEEAGFHTSLDDTAEPGTGWYLRWTSS